MTKASFKNTLYHGSKYLAYNIAIFGIYFTWIFISIARRGKPMLSISELSTINILSIIAATIFLTSSLMGELFMLITDATHVGNN